MGSHQRRPRASYRGLNEINTINVIQSLVTFLNEHRDASPALPLIPNETSLKELHRAGTLFLLEKPGDYREVPVVVRDQQGNVVHRPPPWGDVPTLMTDFFTELQRIWSQGDALDAAGLALWRINWVHPFKNGNGRTARAYSYACLCARLEVWLEGQPTVIAQIKNTRPEYEAALRAGDAGDLTVMRSYLAL